MYIVRPNSFDEKIVLLSLDVPDTNIEPVLDVFAVGVNVAVYVLPLPLIVPSVPPVTVTCDDVN